MKTSVRVRRRGETHRVEAEPWHRPRRSLRPEAKATLQIAQRAIAPRAGLVVAPVGAIEKTEVHSVQEPKQPKRNLVASPYRHSVVHDKTIWYVGYLTIALALAANLEEPAT